MPARTADGLGWRERGSPRAPSSASPSSSPPPHSSSTVASPKLISELVFCPSALGTWRRNGDERICSDPGELTGRGRGRRTGRRLNQSASLSLSPPPAPGRPLCLLGGQVLAEDDDDDDNNEGGGSGAGQEGGPAAAGKKERRRGRAGLCLRDKSFLGRWWRGGCGR